jgi:hypothetical protein
MNRSISFLLCFAFSCFTAVFFVSPVTQGQEVYRTYNNARFAYSISYPASLLQPQGEAANGDGQKFLAGDGSAELIVYGGYNALNRTLKQAYTQEATTSADHPRRVVTYKVLRPTWFVISGHEGGKIFYQKTMLKGDTFKTFRIEYDESEKAVFDPVTKRIEKSFRG